MKSISDSMRLGRVIRSIKSTLDGDSSDLTREAACARKAALAAGVILKQYYGGKYEVGSKGHDNPVTVADIEADRAIYEILHRAFPDYGWLSEETVDNFDRLEKRRVWIVDPLDGTKEFINNVPEFCVAIGLVDQCARSFLLLVGEVGFVDQGGQCFDRYRGFAVLARHFDGSGVVPARRVRTLPVHSAQPPLGVNLLDRDFGADPRLGLRSPYCASKLHIDWRSTAR